MKEKISKYIDGEGNKEEIKKLLKENKEAREYYEQLVQMKAVLSEMKVSAPSDIEKNVLGKMQRRHTRVPYIVISFAMVFLVSFLFLKVTNLNFKQPIQAPTTDNNMRLTQPAEKGAEEKGTNIENVPSYSLEGFEVIVEENKKEDVIILLKQYGEIKEEKKNTFTYTLDSEKLPVVLKKLEEIGKVKNINIKEQKGPVTLTVRINFP